MIVKEFSHKEFRAVYRLYMRQDFPRSELKTLRRMEKLRDEGLCQAYGLYYDKGLAAYAYFLKREESSVRLLDYYAVCAERGKGYGTAFMLAIAKLFEQESCLLAEVETPDDAAFESERDRRHRRKTFYARNGFDPTSLRVSMFGTKLDVIVLPLKSERPEDDAIEAEMRALYKLVYPMQGKKIFIERGEEPEDMTFRTSVK